MIQKILIIKYCEKCGKEFQVYRNIKKTNIVSLKEKRFCSRSCANSRIISEKTKNKISKSNSGSKGSNYIDGRSLLDKFCIECGKKLGYKNQSGYCYKCIKHYNKYIEKLSISLKGKTGGYREKGGRGKQGWYKGYFCSSSWELAYVIYNLENNIKFKRNKKGFDYIIDGEKHKYYPDFLLENNVYVEIKGLKYKGTKEKIEQFPCDIEVIDKTKIKKYIEFVVERYGKNFIELYE